MSISQADGQVVINGGRMRAAWFLRAGRDGRTLAALLIIVAYLLAGIVGHDPWKQDEAYTFGIVLNILASGDWVVPTLAAEPFMEKPPLYYLVAAGTASILSPWLPLHDGARLASVGFMALGLACVVMSARRLAGPGRGLTAALLVVGCLGLAPHAHELITDTALFTGFAMALYGLSWALDRSVVAGALAGTGVGIGLMSKGLVEPAMVGLAMLVLPLAFRSWRSRTYAASAGWCVLFLLPWLIVWPLALFQRSEALFVTWFWTNNVGRYFGFANLGADSEAWYYMRVVPWFTLPALPLALSAAWRARLGSRRATGVELCVTLCCAMLAILGSSATARSLYLVPLLAPLCVLAAMPSHAAVGRVMHGATKALAFVAAAVLVLAWWIWGSGTATGVAPAIPGLDGRLPSRFDFGWRPGLVAAAVAITVLWFFAWMRARRLSWIHLWAANVAASWGIVMTLLLPWIDSAKSFREPFEDLGSVVSEFDCVSSSGLGEPQRGMLHYINGITTLRIEHDGVVCPLHLLQSDHSGRLPPLPAGRWVRIWSGSRREETTERFELYANATPSPRLAIR